MELHDLVIKRFIQRRDVKAKQRNDGSYFPVREPWKRSDVVKHIRGTETFGNYLADQDNLVKFFAFDLDLKESGTLLNAPNLEKLPQDITGDALDTWYEAATWYEKSHPRSEWLNGNESCGWYTLQLRTLAEILSSTIKLELGIPCLTAFSGSKGLHVYGFCGVVPATEAREAALLVLEEAGANNNGAFIPVKGQSTFEWIENSDSAGVGTDSNITVEVFPKQDHITDLGNLMRLPLGRNLKNPSAECFFIDQTAPHTKIVAHPYPAKLLSGADPWS